MICAYSPYSASDTSGNDWADGFLAGVLIILALRFLKNIGASSGRNLEYASTILFAISLVVVVAIYIIYWKGPTLCKRSPFAHKLAGARQENLHEGRRASITHDDDRRGKQGVNSLFESWLLTIEQPRPLPMVEFTDVATTPPFLWQEPCDHKRNPPWYPFRKLSPWYRQSEAG